MTVTDKQIARDVVVQFGPKGSKLDGLLVDAVTNRPITKATITFRRVDNPELAYIRGPAEAKEKGRFSDTVPAVPFTIEVSAEGYETEKTKALLVMRGEGKRVKIALHPKIQNAK